MHRLQEALKQAIEAQLNANTAGDAEATDRHFRFLVAQMALWTAGLVSFPVWLAVASDAAPVSALVFLWLLAPIAAIGVVMRSGRLGLGQGIAAAALTAFTVWVVARSGGMASPLLLLFAAVPLLSRLAMQEGTSRSLAFALAGIGMSIILDLLRHGSPAAGWTASMVMICASVGAVAVVSRWPSRGQATPVSNRPSALLDEGGDLITRHDSSGNVGAASEIARELLGIEPDQLHGRGLARRVHIEDRTRFDQALHDAATGDVTVRVAYRMTRATSGLATHEWFESSFRRASGDADDIQIVGVTRATSDPDGARRVAPGSPLTPNRSDDVERALDAVVRFSQLLSNPQITPRQDEWQSYGRLLRVAGAQLSESVGVNVSNATLAAPDTNNPKTSLLSVVREAAADASVRGGPVVVADAVDEAALDTPAAECTHVVANILRALRHRMPVDGSWIISTQHGDRTARLTFRVAMPKLPVKPLGAYTGLASVLELGLSESAAIVAKWGGELSIGKPDPTGPEVVLELPLAHPDRGGDDLEDERWSEVRKSA